MAEVKVHFDRTGKTLTVWFGDPREEAVCEEIGDEVILMKSRHVRVIGFEKLNFSVSKPESLRVAFESVESDSERIPRGLPRGKRANIK